MAPPQFQAYILCGPGMSLNTFTSNPSLFPKALLPVANRPMIWYPLQWCYRAGISDITLITPPESQQAIQAALSQNPHLTSLSGPKPSILSPASLSLTTATGEIFRLPEIQKSITTDFIVLPCDFICEIDCSDVLESWLLLQGAIGGNSVTKGSELLGGDARKSTWPAGESLARRGGLTIFYNAANSEGKVAKDAETDFAISTPIQNSISIAPRTALTKGIEKLVATMPTDTLKDVLDDDDEADVRQAALTAFDNIKIRAQYRDSHLYVFPHWIKHFIAANEELHSLGEDVVGWWSRACWQKGLGHELGLSQILQTPEHPDKLLAAVPEKSSTFTTPSVSNELAVPSVKSFASRVPGAQITREDSFVDLSIRNASPISPSAIPPVLTFFHNSETTGQVICRADTVSSLLTTSLRLAALPPATAAIASTPASPFAHPAKIAHPDRVPRQCRVEQDNSLLDANVTVGERVNIKECVIGANCEIGSGARLVRCVLMDGAFVGENVTLSGCVIGFRARLEGGSRKDSDRTDLRDCQIQEEMVVPWGVDAKNEIFMISNLHDDFDSADDGAESAKL